MLPDCCNRDRRVERASRAGAAPSASNSLARSTAAAALVSAALLTGACAIIPQVDDRMEYSRMSLAAGDLESSGLGFMTPATATGREADKPSLAMLFAATLARARPDIRVVPLPAILSAVNAAGLNQQYKQMYRDYLETGILDGDLLRRVGEIGEVRYLVQLNLAAFEQQTRGRFGFLGMRLIDTKQANMRVFVQIWDSTTGAIAWEGGGELNYASDSGWEAPVTFHVAADEAAKRIFAQLPAREDSATHAD